VPTLEATDALPELGAFFGTNPPIVSGWPSPDRKCSTVGDLVSMFDKIPQTQSAEPT